MRVRRIAAYGLCRDDEGRVLLARGSATADLPGHWQFPGGGIDHGEHPDRTVVREFAEETGLVVRPLGVRAVVSDVLTLAGGIQQHTDRIIYDVAATGEGVLRHETSGTSDRAEWIEPDRLAGLPMMPFTAELLGLPPQPPAQPAGGQPPTADEPERDADSPAPAARGQRFGAYAVATDPAGRVLLTLIAEGYPGAGRWHLPGGGTDHGEQPDTALLRELAEETNQLGRVTGLLAVDHHHNPRALGPEGYPIDWHVVRAIFRVTVDVPTQPRVTEAAGGSTAQARWFTASEIADLALSDVAVTALAHLRDGRSDQRS